MRQPNLSTALENASAVIPLSAVRLQAERTAYERFLKPVIDRLGALVGLLVTLPIWLLATIAVFLQLGRPIFYTQERVGRNGELFRLYKFRTMEPDRRERELAFAGEDRRATHKTVRDPRHTTVGRFLRRWSLDELPQLINVLRGEMSLIGPRPELPQIVADYEPWQQQRHEVKPGITGLWQVTARNTTMHEYAHLDVQYIERVSLREDLRILGRTVVVVGRGTGS